MSKCRAVIVVALLVVVLNSHSTVSAEKPAIPKDLRIGESVVDGLDGWKYHAAQPEPAGLAQRGASMRPSTAVGEFVSLKPFDNVARFYAEKAGLPKNALDTNVIFMRKTILETKLENNETKRISGTVTRSNEYRRVVLLISTISKRANADIVTITIETLSDDDEVRIMVTRHFT